MLPVEGLTEVVSFLPVYDLDSVLLANRRLSNVASKCVKRIRVWQFDYVHIFVDEKSVALGELVMDDRDDDGRQTLIAVESQENMTELLDIALRNGLFEVLSFFVAPGAVIPLPNKSALMVKKLDLCVKGVPSADFLVDIIKRFRKVQVVNLFECETITDFSPVVDFCRQKGIRRVTHNYEDLMEWQ